MDYTHIPRGSSVGRSVAAGGAGVIQSRPRSLSRRLPLYHGPAGDPLQCMTSQCRLAMRLRGHNKTGCTSVRRACATCQATRRGLARVHAYSFECAPRHAQPDPPSAHALHTPPWTPMGPACRRVAPETDGSNDGALGRHAPSAWIAARPRGLRGRYAASAATRAAV